MTQIDRRFPEDCFVTGNGNESAVRPGYWSYWRRVAAEVLPATGVTLVSYGEPMSGDSEGDLYEMITGHRSSTLDDAAELLKVGGTLTINAALPAALDSQAIEYSALDAYWDAFRRDAEEVAPTPPLVVDKNITKERMEAYFRALIELCPREPIEPAPSPNTTTAPSCSGLTTAAHDGERLGRLNWTPGAR